MHSSIDSETLANLESLLVRFVYEEYLDQKWRGEGIPTDLFRSFSAHARKLSDLFTLQRRNFEPGYLRSKESRSAYLLYFHLANVVRSMAVLEEMHKRNLLPQKPLRVLDVGAGPAPSLWAILFLAKKYDFTLSEVEAWDQEGSILKNGRKLWEELTTSFERKVPFRTNVVGFHRMPRVDKRFDLIFCSNVLNELGRDPFQIAQKLHWLTDTALSEGGKLLIVEPALLRISRATTLMRDELLKQGGLQTPIPCGHSGECPLNREPKDWCHFDVEWTAPPIRRRIEKFLEHRTGKLKYTYLVIEKKEGPEHPSAYRVLSDPISNPRGDCLLLCDSPQKIALYYKKALDQFRRGDLIQIENADISSIQGPVHRYAKEVQITSGLKVKRV